MTKPVPSELEVKDGVNDMIRISIDRDADPCISSFVLDQDNGGDYFYVTLEGLRALVSAAEQLEAMR